MRQAAASLLLCPPLLILLAAFVKRRHGTSGQRLLAARAPKKEEGHPSSEGRPSKAPLTLASGRGWTSLENKLQSQLQCPRVAREHSFRIVEFGITRLQETPTSGVADRLNIVQ